MVTLIPFGAVTVVTTASLTGAKVIRRASRVNPSKPIPTTASTSAVPERNGEDRIATHRERRDKGPVAAADAGATSLVLIDLARRTTIGVYALDKAPRALSFRPDGHELYFTLAGSNDVQVLDPNTPVESSRRSRSAFNPTPLNISVGATVTWTNHDGVPNTVTSSGFDSGDLPSAPTFRHTFDKAGTFLYRCTIHPSMVGTVLV